ncbi:MAG: 16S rRNA (guanine(527)-N(7))-methyltransferase RsmG [Candidatus Eremiobacteraeota bacterium]|nr:16S rRNA (guanine(527)-N(7))-methyltransferase RsmG [Candidatus Eremiobacteraeota bacterium]
MFEELIQELLLAQKIGTGLAASLARYGALVLTENRSFNLTGAATPVEIVAHIMDALSVAPFLGDPHIDVGSGAGFPAIPAALGTGIEIALVESSRKKAAFLSRVIGELGVRGTVVHARAERAAHDPAFREHFASATARAVSSAPAVAELTVPFVRIGGVAVLQRGRTAEHERQALAGASHMLGAGVPEIRAVEGHNVIFFLHKKQATHRRFPRRDGVPQKRPLCFT